MPAEGPTDGSPRGGVVDIIGTVALRIFLQYGTQKQSYWGFCVGLNLSCHLDPDALRSFFLRFASALPLARCSLAAFMSFGTVVDSCLMCVGTNNAPNSPGLELEVCSGWDNHAARRTGTESSRDWKASNSGVVF